MADKRHSGLAAGSPPWDRSGGYLLPDTIPVFHYPDGRRVVGWPGTWPWLATGGAA